MVAVAAGAGGGSALSQSRKNITLAFHASRGLWKSRFTRKKKAISHFTGNKKGRSRVTKIPFSTLGMGFYVHAGID